MCLKQAVLLNMPLTKVVHNFSKMSSLCEIMSVASSLVHSNFCTTLFHVVVL